MQLQVHEDDSPARRMSERWVKQQAPIRTERITSCLVVPSLTIAPYVTSMCRSWQVSVYFVMGRILNDHHVSWTG